MRKSDFRRRATPGTGNIGELAELNALRREFGIAVSLAFCVDRP